MGKLWSGQVRPLVQERLEKPDREQGVPTRPLDQPGSQRVRGLAPEDRLRQLDHAFRAEGMKVDPPQNVVLLQGQRHVASHVVPGQLPRPGCCDDQEPGLGDAPPEVTEKLPR